MKIGLTIRHLEKYKENLFASGIEQHIMYFYDYLKTTGHDIFLLSFLSKETNNPDWVDLRDGNKLASLDVIIVIGNRGPSNGATFFKQHNVKVITYILGSDFITNTKELLNVNNKDHFYHGIIEGEEVWISPHFEFSIDYYKYIYKTDKVYVAPYFWRPLYIGKPLTFPLSCNLSVAIMESNFISNKSCFVPIMVCERAKDYIKKVDVYGAKKLMKGKMFIDFLEKSDLYINNKLYIKGRQTFTNIIEKQCNVVVSYSHDCDLNYLFLECFYKGVPLIHNSVILKDWGFYYPRCDVSVAAEHLKRLSLGIFNREYYIERHKPLLQKYSMNNQINQDFFNKRLSL